MKCFEGGKDNYVVQFTTYTCNSQVLYSASGEIKVIKNSEASSVAARSR